MTKRPTPTGAGKSASDEEAGPRGRIMTHDLPRNDAYMGGRVQSTDVALGLVVSTHHVDAVDEDGRRGVRADEFDYRFVDARFGQAGVGWVRRCDSRGSYEVRCASAAESSA